MKWFNLILAGITIMSVTCLTGCIESANEKTEHVEEAEYKLMTAEADLEKSKADSAMAYTSFQMETDRVLAENEIKMLELKARLLTRRSEINTQYENDLEALRLENEKLKTDLKTFTYGSKENWENFKSNVNRDLDKLGKSISAMAEKSEKKN
jgi:phosphopantetheine adenylyltransferase